MRRATSAPAPPYSETTIKTRVLLVFRKLHLRHRVQAVVLAYERGLAQPTADEGHSTSDSIPTLASLMGPYRAPAMSSQ